MPPQAGIRLPEVPLPELRRQLWQLAGADTEELALAAASLFGAPPPPDQLPELLDFVAVNWVDAEGFTLAERLRRSGGPGLLERWPVEVRDALFVVDGWEAGQVLLRDLASEEEIAVRAVGAEADLPRRTVLRARVVPFGEGMAFFGEPSLYGEQGVIGRQQLLAAWRDSPEPATIERQRELRLGFAEQRAQRAAFCAHFGGDEVTFPTADALETQVATFLGEYLHGIALRHLGGRTHAEAWAQRKGARPPTVELRVGASLRDGGNPAVVFDEVHGVHFLPSFAQLRAHLVGDAEHPHLAALYVQQPELPALALRRAGPLHKLSPFLGGDPGQAAARLQARKPMGRALPAYLPTFDEQLV